MLGKLAIWVAILALESSAGAVQYGLQQRLAVGDLLIASEKLGDPNFAESVVFLIRRDSEEGTLGLIINRRSEVPLSRAFPDVKGANGDLVYLGGPVSPSVVQILLRSPSKANELEHISGDVYSSAKKSIIEKSIRARLESSKLRVYAGYAGWAPGQLENEIRTGAWTVLASGGKYVFDDHPESLWSRLNREAHMEVADGINRNHFGY